MISPETMLHIEQAIFRYSFALDTRRWEEMNEVFAPSARIVLGETVFTSRREGIEAIRSFIECCSVTHHMNSNTLVRSARDEVVHTVCNFQAWHRGKGTRADEVLECLGTYEDEFRRGPDGWRIVERRESAPVVIGDFKRFFSDRA